jgi:hypothetical protein
VLAVYIYDAGADVLGGADPVAGGGGEVDGDLSGGVAEIWDATTQEPTGQEWSGKGGNSYDVYPTLYCVADPSSYDYFNNNPSRIYGAGDFSAPITYEQDGNKTISTTYSDTNYPENSLP